MSRNLNTAPTYSDNSEAFKKARADFTREVCDFYGRNCKAECPFFGTQICNNVAGITRTRFIKTVEAFIEYRDNGTPIPEKYLRKDKSYDNKKN